MRFESLVGRQERGELTQIEAAEMLGVSVRTFQRWVGRLDEWGAEGLADRRLGRRSPRRAPEAELERMLGLYRDKYEDFTVKHFHEQPVKRHNYVLGYTVTKLALHAAGLVRRAPKRSAHRKKRPRRPLRGMLLHQDGSRHAWLEGQPALDLIVTMDDATSDLLSLFLVAEEGTASTFRGLREVVAKYGLFCALYTDRGSHYFETPQAGGKVSKTQLTQVGRARHRSKRRCHRRSGRRRQGSCRTMRTSVACQTKLDWARRHQYRSAPGGHTVPDTGGDRRAGAVSRRDGLDFAYAFNRRIALAEHDTLVAEINTFLDR